MAWNYGFICVFSYNLSLLEDTLHKAGAAVCSALHSWGISPLILGHVKRKGEEGQKEREVERKGRCERRKGFSGGAVIRNPPAYEADAGDASSIPGLGKSPEVGNGSPFQHSCPRNPIDRVGRDGTHTHRRERREVKQEKEREAEGWKRGWRRKGGSLMTRALTNSCLPPLQGEQLGSTLRCVVAPSPDRWSYCTRCLPHLGPWKESCVCTRMRVCNRTLDAHIRALA